MATRLLGMRGGGPEARPSPRDPVRAAPPGVAAAPAAWYPTGMPPPYERHLFICTNRRPDGAPRPSCAARGSEAIRDAFKKELAARGLNHRIRANASGCLDGCECGPSVVVYPEGFWYGELKLEDVPEIVEEHLVGGRPVERLRMKFDEVAKRRGAGTKLPQTP